MEIVVHGGGYVGLTGAVHAALAGYSVIMYDPDQSVVDAINSGKPKANEYLGYIGQNIEKLISSGKIRATTDYDSIKSKPVHFLAVPTEVKNEPCMDIVKTCLYRLGETIPEGGVIIVESTLQPGTTDDILHDYLFRRDVIDTKRFYLAVCPRLDWFADSTKNVTNLPRIVGGVNGESTEKAAEILAPICQDIHKTNYRVAEMAKAGQNALYFVQIAAAYQMAEMYQNHVDMNDVLKAIGLHWRLPNLYLGAGTSGRCVAMGAQYIVEGAKEINRRKDYYNNLFELALHLDKEWREKIGDVLTRRFSFPESLEIKILVAGIAYCPNFSDFGYSAGLDIAKYLRNHAWNVSIHDPIVSRETLERATKIPIDEGCFYPDYDVILLTTAHDVYRCDPNGYHLWKKGQLVLDCTGMWENSRELFKKHGVDYVRVGQKGWMNR